MSELDIQLQEQTSDVSVTEMMQETEKIKTALKSQETKIEESSREDGNDGK